MDDDGREAALLDQLDSVLADGPVGLDDLTELLAEGGYLDHWDADDFDDLVEQLNDLLSSYDGFWFAPGELVASTPALVAATVFTHRLTAEEIARAMVDVHPDLVAVGADIDPLPIVGGGVLDLAFAATDEGAAEGGSFVGPDGWLAPFSAGDLVGFRRTDDGVVVERVDTAPAAGDLEVAELARAFGIRVPDREIGVGIMAIVLDAITAQPAVFTSVVRPLGELLADAGFEARGDWMGPIGVDWQPPHLSDAEADRALLVERYQLEACCLDHLDRAMDAWNALVLPSADTVIDWASVATSLAHGFVSPAFADHVLQDDDDPRPLLLELADLVRAAAPRGEAPAAFLRARNFEAAGDALAAETELQKAVRVAPEFDAALDELAWYTADRGDSEQAINLLRRSGVVAGDSELTFLESMRPKRNVVGRNEPCPCGSGRKYKDCCLRTPKLSASRHSDWLHHKLWTFVLRPARQWQTLALGLVLAHDEDGADELLDIGLPMDLAAFEGGGAATFLDQRGMLLPAAERAMLEHWIEQPRALWELLGAESDGTLHLRDTDTGSEVAVMTTTDQRAAGSLVYARIGAAGEAFRFVGVPIDIDPDGRDSVEALIALDPSALDIAEWFAEMTELPS